MKFIKRNIKSIIGYTLFSIVVFMLFLYLLFPREAIKARIIYEIEKGTATEIKTAGDRWVFPFGLTLKGVELTRKAGGKGHLLTRIDRLAIEVPVRSIFLSPVSMITADFSGGSAKGLLTLRGDNRIIQANWTNVDISRVEGLKDVPAEMSGKASGDLVIRLMSNNPEGQIRFLIKDGKLSKLNIMGFTLPDLPVDELKGLIDINGYTLLLKDVSFRNSDIHGDIKGDIQLKTDAGEGNLNISIHFAVSDKMQEQYEDILSFAEESEDREGYYILHIKGDMKKPTLDI